MRLRVWNSSTKRALGVLVTRTLRPGMRVQSRRPEAATAPVLLALLTKSSQLPTAWNSTVRMRSPSSFFG